MSGLKRTIRCDEKESMTADTDMTSLRHEELVALVRQLRQQLAERDQEIERLKRQAAESHAPVATAETMHETASATRQETLSGSREDLLAQLEKIYPET